MSTEAVLTPARGAVGSAWLAGGFALFLAASASAGAVEVEVRDHLVAVRADDEPLRNVLAAVAERCDLEIRANAPMSERVTVDTGQRPLPQLLRSLLRDHSYVLQYSNDGAGPRSVWILAPAGDADDEAPWTAAARADSLDEVVLALAHPDMEVRVEAVLALGDIGSREVEPFLTQSLADESDDVREAARAVLEDMGVWEAGPQGAGEPGAD